jgi:diamine N-acetyltransferase
MLTNKTIRLRALEPEDLDLLYRWENDASLWRTGNTLAPYSRYVLKEYIARSHLNIYESKQLRLIIERLEPCGGIGIIDLYDFDPHSRKAGVGILLDAQHRGNGLATSALNLLTDYAFTFLKLHQLYAYVSVANEPSKALFLRCGFTVTGRLPDWMSTEDGFDDVLVMQRINVQKQ